MAVKKPISVNNLITAETVATKSRHKRRLTGSNLREGRARGGDQKRVSLSRLRTNSVRTGLDLGIRSEVQKWASRVALAPKENGQVPKQGKKEGEVIIISEHGPWGMKRGNRQNS